MCYSKGIETVIGDRSYLNELFATENCGDIPASSVKGRVMVSQDHRVGFWHFVYSLVAGVAL